MEGMGHAKGFADHRPSAVQLTAHAKAHAERFVRSIKMECLDRVVLVGEWHLRRLVREFVDHYREERNHQGIGNELIQPVARTDGLGVVRRRQRMGGMLNFYYRAAA